MSNCTSSVNELIEKVKGTPYGVLTRKSKTGKPQSIQFNETVDSFADVIKDDCKSASRHGRFADGNFAEGTNEEVCEQALAEEAPCFQIGFLNSTKVLKSRLKKSHSKKNDDYDDYQEKQFEAEEKNFNLKTLESKKKQLEKTRKDSEKYSTLHDRPPTSRFWKKERNEDFYAMKKTKLRNEIRDLEENLKPKTFTNLSENIYYYKNKENKIILHLPFIYYDRILEDHVKNDLLNSYNTLTEELWIEDNKEKANQFLKNYKIIFVKNEDLEDYKKGYRIKNGIKGRSEDNFLKNLNKDKKMNFPKNFNPRTYKLPKNKFVQEIEKRMKPFLGDLKNYIEGSKPKMKSSKMKSKEKTFKIVMNGIKPHSINNKLVKNLTDSEMLKIKIQIENYLNSGSFSSNKEKELLQQTHKYLEENIYKEYETARNKKMKAESIKREKLSQAMQEKIFYATIDNSIFLKLDKVYYLKMIPQAQVELKKNFKWNPYDKVWKAKTKNAIQFLQKYKIPEKISNVETRKQPEEIKVTRNQLKLIQEPSNQRGYQMNFNDRNINDRLDKIEADQKAIANVVLHIKPKVDKIERDMETVKNIAIEHKTYQENKYDNGDIF